jgi:hypothetical protein
MRATKGTRHRRDFVSMSFSARGTYEGYLYRPAIPGPKEGGSTTNLDLLNTHLDR